MGGFFVVQERRNKNMSQENLKPFSELFSNGIVPTDSPKEPRFPGVDASWVYDSKINNYRPASKKPAKTDKIKN